MTTPRTPLILAHLKASTWPADSGRPKYLVFRDALLEAARLAGCTAGERLPTETELAEVAPFSLGTVQRAVRALVEEGRVTRRQGSGTFISAHTKEMPNPLQCRFLTEDGLGYLPVYPRVLERVRIAQKGPWSKVLGQRGDNIVRIDRIIDIGEHFAVFARFHARVDRHPALEEMPASALDGESLTRLLLGERAQCDFVEHVVADVFSDWICAAIGVAAGTTGLLISTTATSNGAALYVQDLYVPPVRWRLKIAK